MQESIQNIYKQIVEKLVKTRILNIDEFNTICNNALNTTLEANINIEIAKSLGIPLKINGENLYLKTYDDLKWQNFCFVDIETTGGIPQKYDIIEIAAIKYKNGNIIESFESFSYAKEIPSKITELTGILSSDIINAPHISNVLEKFKIFIGDDVFVAHNAGFDFNFINVKLLEWKLPPMLNRTICTLELARKTIQAQKYGLGYLNEYLNINHPIRHRAYADSLITKQVLEYIMINLPKWINCAEDIINLTKHGDKYSNGTIFA